MVFKAQGSLSAQGNPVAKYVITTQSNEATYHVRGLAFEERKEFQNRCNSAQTAMKDMLAQLIRRYLQESQKPQLPK